MRGNKDSLAEGTEMEVKRLRKGGRTGQHVVSIFSLPQQIGESFQSFPA